MVSEPKPYNDDRLPVSFDYDDNQKKEILEALELLRSQATGPFNFAGRLVDRFERSPNFLYETNKGNVRRAPSRDGGADQDLVLRTKEQISEYFKWPIEEFAKKPLAYTTWRFLDVCAQLILRDTGLVLNSEIFRPFGTESVTLADALGTSGAQNLFLQSIIKQADHRSGILCIGAAEDEFHARIKLWISVDPQASKQQIETDVTSENYEFVRRWDGLIRFEKPHRGLTEQESTFNGYDAVSIVREHRYNTPGALRIGPRRNNHSNCVLSTPHNEAEYELQDLEGQ